MVLEIKCLDFHAFCNIERALRGASRNRVTIQAVVPNEAFRKNQDPQVHMYIVQCTCLYYRAVWAVKGEEF
jgi:hypothetical protein